MLHNNNAYMVPEQSLQQYYWQSIFSFHNNSKSDSNNNTHFLLPVVWNNTLLFAFNSKIFISFIVLRKQHTCFVEFIDKSFVFFF